MEAGAEVRLVLGVTGRKELGWNLPMLHVVIVDVVTRGRCTPTARTFAAIAGDTLP